MGTIVEMRVTMDCPGCEHKIMKALSKLDGVDSVDIDMNMQKVTVTGWADQKKVLKTVRKTTGRSAELWPSPYNPEYHDYTYHYYPNYYGYGSPAANYGYNSSPANYYYDADKRPSMYNYRKHGYNGHEYGYYQQPPSAAILDEESSAMFSDDNATGCSIM